MSNSAFKSSYVVNLTQKGKTESCSAYPGLPSLEALSKHWCVGYVIRLEMHLDDWVLELKIMKVECFWVPEMWLEYIFRNKTGNARILTCHRKLSLSTSKCLVTIFWTILVILWFGSSPVSPLWGWYLRHMVPPAPPRDNTSYKFIRGYRLT